MREITFSFLDKDETYIFDKFAKQASGSVYYKSGDNVLLATVAVDCDSIVEEDFLPLTVQYIEKAYAAGKFPGGYILENRDGLKRAYKGLAYLQNNKKKRA